MKEFSKRNAKEECERITKIARKYENCYEELYRRKCKEVVRKAYGMGGEMMHRGYLCPKLYLTIKEDNIGNYEGQTIVLEPQEYGTQDE